MSIRVATLPSASSSILAELRAGQVKSLRGVNLQGMDLGKVDLKDCDISFADLSGADLRGANLANVFLKHANLANADLSSANLKGAIFRQVTATSARFRGSNLEAVKLELCDLTDADLSAANLQGASIRACTLEKADLTGSDLAHAMITYSLCNEANFEGANLEDATGVGSSYKDAILDNARNFDMNRDIVVTILARHIDKDIERAQVVGAISLLEGWCWDAWQRYYQDEPDYLQEWALAVFKEYPQSGCLEALLGDKPILDEKS